MTDTETDIEDIVLDTDLELGEDDELDYYDYDDLDLVDLEEDDDDDDDVEDSDHEFDHPSKQVSSYKGKNMDHYGVSSSSTSATVQYVMDSILPTTEEATQRKIYKEQDDLLGNVLPYTDQEEDEVYTPGPTDRSIRRNQIEHSIKRRLDKMSQQLEDWKHRHDDFIHEEDDQAMTNTKRHALTKQSRMKSPVMGVVKQSDFNRSYFKQSTKDATSSKADILQQELLESKKEIERLKSTIEIQGKDISREAQQARENKREEKVEKPKVEAKKRAINVVIKLQTICKSQQEEINKLKRDLLRTKKALKSQIDQNEKKLRERDNELGEIRDLYERTVDDIHKKERLLDEHVTSLNDNCRTQHQKAKRQSEISIELRHKLNAKIDECKQLEKTIKNMENKEKEFREKEKSNTILQKRYSDLLSQNRDLKKQIDESQTQLQELQADKTDLSRKIRDNEEQHRQIVQDLEYSNKQLEAKVRETENNVKEIQLSNNRENTRLSLSHKDQIERVQRDLMEWKQTCKELNDDLDRVKREHGIKLKSAEDVLNQKLSEVLDRERKYKEQNRTLQKKVEELLQKSLVNEQYLTEQIEWKTRYEQEVSKWRVEKLGWANERLDMEDQLKKLKDIQEQTQEGIRSDIEKYKAMLHKERYMRESLENKILELNNTISELERKSTLQREMANMDALKTEDQSQKISDIRRAQKKLEQNYSDMQQKLASYMHKYNQTLREMSNLKNIHSKAIEQMKIRTFNRNDTYDSDTDASSDASMDQRTTRKSLKDIADLQVKCDEDVKEYKSKMSSLIKDMTNHGQEISGLRQAFQMLKSKMAAIPPPKTASSKRTSMLNNYEGSSDEDRFDQLSDASYESTDDERTERSQAGRMRSRSADSSRRVQRPVSIATEKVKVKSKKLKSDLLRPTISSAEKSKSKLASVPVSSTIKKKK